MAATGKVGSIKATARAAGSLYLVIFIANMFAYFFVGSSLVVPGDAKATANSIMASEPLFRSGIVSYLVVFLSDIGVAVLLYLLLKPVNRTLALVMMVSRLIQTTVHGANLLNQFFPLLLLGGGDYLAGFGPDQVNALVLLFLNAHSYGVLLSEAFFGLSTVLLGYLVYRSSYFPRIVGALLVVASLAYFLDSFGIFLLPSYEAIIKQVIVAPAIIGEMAFTLWLLIKGVSVERRQERALQPA